MKRTAEITRTTKETDVSLALTLDGTRDIQIATGIAFFDHMLELFAFHGGFDLRLKAKGDWSVDDHHTVEDVGIALGQAFAHALGDKRGVNRYGLSYLPMDETLARAVVDLSGRPYLHYKATFGRVAIGGLSLENVREFLRAFTTEARLSLHIEVLYGENDHHKVESLFKALGRSLKEAVERKDDQVQSTKGVLA
jgi:imidazoleglycerol-phosphate dehydratase